jgi:hypothetical protein
VPWARLCTRCQRAEEAREFLVTANAA